MQEPRRGGNQAAHGTATGIDRSRRPAIAGARTPLTAQRPAGAASDAPISVLLSDAPAGRYARAYAGDLHACGVLALLLAALV